MTQPANPNNVANVTLPAIGVGLRHPHFSEALDSPANIDFLEVHSENFFAAGGASLAVLDKITENYPVSLHSTSMGLGSAKTIPDVYLRKLAMLIERVNPMLVSDHACYTWSDINSLDLHAGDLLPLSFDQDTLTVLIDNVDRVQNKFGRKILIENLSAYVNLGNSAHTEAEFLSQLVKNTGCGILLDLNNIIVSAKNIGIEDNLAYAKKWLDTLPTESVGEIHLAGFKEAVIGELVVDDHSQAVSLQCWDLYAYALRRFGAIPTLIEWDNDLPSWTRLLEEADTARGIAFSTLKAES